MKAKEYFQKFEKEFDGVNGKDLAKNIMKDFISEIVGISEVRNVKSKNGVASILRELNDKWNCLSRLSKGVFVKNGFFKYLKENRPELYLWLEEK